MSENKIIGKITEVVKKEGLGKEYLDLLRELYNHSIKFSSSQPRDSMTESMKNMIDTRFDFE